MNMNVVLIDKHPVFRTGIRVMLKSQFEDMDYPRNRVYALIRESYATDYH